MLSGKSTKWRLSFPAEQPYFAKAIFNCCEKQKEMTRFLGVLLLGCILSVASCDLGSLNDPIVVPYVDDEFHAELWEVFTPQRRELQLRLTTIEAVECLNASIEVEFRRLGDNEHKLSIKSILNPDNCQEGSAPARRTVKVGELSNGTYPLSISLREAVESEGRIIVRDDFFRLYIDEGAGVLPLRNTLRRIPDGTIWGYISSEGGEGLGGAAEGFRSDLSSIAIPQALDDGHYGYFSIEDGSIDWETASEGGQVLTAFQFFLPPEQEQAVKDLLENFRTQQSDSLSLQVFHTSGEDW